MIFFIKCTTNTHSMSTVSTGAQQSASSDAGSDADEEYDTATDNSSDYDDGHYEDTARCLFDNTGEVDAIDYAKPLGKNNLAIVPKELVCRFGDSEEIRQLQMDLHVAALTKSSASVSTCIEQLAHKGHARNFIALMGLLAHGEHTGRVQDREYDKDFDKNVFNALKYVTNMPRTVLQPPDMLRTAIAVNDPLLLATALDVGAKINDPSFSVSPLHNAKARGHDELVCILTAEARSRSCL